MSGIRVENLSKRFGSYTAVDQVGFEVKEGELVALLGPSGSGKSTILRIVAGLENANSGKIYLTGKDVTDIRAQKRRVGFVFQHYALFKHMTVEKNIAFGLEIKKHPKDKIRNRVRELIDLVKLNGHESHYPSQLSGGQRQRVALARALAPEPRVLLLDEPFGALDAKVRKNLAQWLRDLHDRIHVTSIFVTHDQSEAMEIADKIVVINRGRVEQIGTPNDVYENPESRFVASFVGNVNVIDAFSGKGFVRISGTENSLSCQEAREAEDSPAVILVRPEDLSVSREADQPNSIPATVASVHYRGSHYEVELVMGRNSVKCRIRREEFDFMSLKNNEPVAVSINKFKFFSACDGHNSVHQMLKQLGYIE